MPFIPAPASKRISAEWVNAAQSFVSNTTKEFPNAIQENIAEPSQAQGKAEVPPDAGSLKKAVATVSASIAYRRIGDSASKIEVHIPRLRRYARSLTKD